MGCGSVEHNAEGERAEVGAKPISEYRRGRVFGIDAQPSVVQAGREVEADGVDPKPLFDEFVVDPLLLVACLDGAIGVEVDAGT